ncbi:hypothetical protein D778_00382 [Xanthomarina gelatinilytica]|uniref:Secretion system C-terminal sorting domain-containing protein n=1 Tax=Xanthomarina gelatinilytica TaxID=1137281 RepID=M7MEV7_9FLAO|nr:T9SS type A sorting domain-containing protein [Xanthomarina gelatinilytica]EMQ94742.1 hypothetical protein D778_00382 [Xanthomarina gelatinilytica]
MKKNYILFLLTVLFAWVGHSQTPCSQNNPAPVTSIIYTNPERGNPIVAFDLAVDAYTQFNLTTITVKMATANLAALNPTGIVKVYSDNLGLPGSELVSETITPTVVTEAPIGTFAIYNVTFTFSTPVELDNLIGDSEAKFWVGFIMGNVNNGDTGVTGGALVAGLPYAVTNDTSGAWVLSSGDPLIDGTYTFEGTCLLSVDDFSLENNISIFPNPVQNELNIQLHNSITVKQVNVYSITGQVVLKAQNARKLDVSDLSPGVYLMKIETDRGDVTRKIIKN